MDERKPPSGCTRIPDIAFGGGFEKGGEKGSRATVQKGRANNESVDRFIVEDDLFSYWAPCNKLWRRGDRGGVGDDVSAIVAVYPGARSEDVCEFRRTLRTEFLGCLADCHKGFFSRSSIS